ANIYKNRSDSLFNFSPLIDVFDSENKSKDESTKSPWKIGFDELELKNIKAGYFNQIDSSGVVLNLGSLLVLANSTDVFSSKIDIEMVNLQKTSLSILVSKNTTLKKVANNPASEFSEIPFDVDLNEMNLGDIHFDLNSNHGNMMLFVDLKQAQVKPKNINLKTFSVEMESLSADQIDVGLQIMPAESTPGGEAGMDLNTQAMDENEEKDDFTFGNFPWDFFLNQAEITNVSYKMDLDSEDRNTSGMDYRHMRFSDFDLLADSIYFNKDRTGAKVKELRGKEISGAELNHVEGKIAMDNQSIRAINISMSTPKSSVKGTASIGYPSLRGIGKYIEKLEIISDLHGTFNVNEISPFTTVLYHYPLLENLGLIDIKNFKSCGTLDNLTLENCGGSVGVATMFRANGSIEGLPSADFKIDLELDTLLTSASDLKRYLPDTLFPSQI
ncbi:MAG: hypothetical protein KAR17_00660, partial [Cyclobacteriaceae bacterium]|nr:hypothetical protein [Cyclobacteriaceae bacterium]